MRKFLSLLGTVIFCCLLASAVPNVNLPSKDRVASAVPKMMTNGSKKRVRTGSNVEKLYKINPDSKTAKKGVKKVVTTTTASATLISSELGLSNSQQVGGQYYGNELVYVYFDKNTGSTIPAYYNSGSSIRIYNGNQVVIGSRYTNVFITDIEFTLNTGNEWVNGPTVSEGSYSVASQSWSGYSTAVSFTTTEKVYIKEICITFVIVNEEEEEQDYYLVGSFNGWDAKDAANKMVPVESLYVKRNVDLSGVNSAGEFKIACFDFSKDWGYGSETNVVTITDNALSAKLTIGPNSNMIYNLNGIYDVYWDPETETVSFDKVGGGSGSGDDPVIEISEFVYNPSEWTYKGECEFKDAWFNVWWSAGTAQPYNVPIYQSKNNPNQYLLLNPYGEGTPYAEINASSEIGYIVIDVTNPNCVLVRPATYGLSSYWDDGEVMSFYCFNQEARYYYYEGMSYEAIINQYSDYLSKYNASEGIISIRNGRFSFGSSDITTGGAYAWRDSDMDGYIILPEFVGSNAGSDDGERAVVLWYAYDSQYGYNIEMQQNANGEYECEVAKVDSFEIVINGSTYCADLNESKLGVNLPLISGNDFEGCNYTPWKGSYKFVVSSDLSTVRVTATSPKPSSIDLYLLGEFSHYECIDAYKFKQISNGEFSYTVTDDIPALWEITDKGGRYFYGYLGAVNPADNYTFNWHGINSHSIKLNKNDVVKVTFDPAQYTSTANVSITRATSGSTQPPVTGDTKTVDINGVVYTLYSDAGYIMATDGSKAKGDVTLIESTEGLNLRGVATGAFKGNGSIHSITIPEGATIIENEAFRECENLQNVNLPSTMTSLGMYSFLDCSYISNFSLPANIDNIGIGAFQNCTDLETFKFNQANLTEIPDALFEGCSQLQEVDIPLSVTKINTNAFLESGVVKIGNTTNVEEVGARAFENSQLAQFDFNNISSIGVAAFKGTKIKSAELLASMTTLNEEAFRNCKNLAKVTLPDDLDEIGKSAFEDCEALSTIEIPLSVTSIKANAFNNSGLVNVMLGNNVTELGNKAFYTTSLTSITLGSGIESLENTPLFTEGLLRINNSNPPLLGKDRLGCEPSAVIVPKGSSATYMADSRWKKYNIIEDGDQIIIHLSAPGALTADLRMKQKLAPQVTSLVIITDASKGTLNDTDWRAIRSNMTALIKLDISDADVKVIPDECLKNKKTLTEIVLPKNLETIGRSAFEGCSLLGEVKLPATLKSIGDRAFSECNSLAGDIIIPAGCTELGAEAFKNCYAINNVSIKSTGLSEIKESSFENCRSIDNVELASGIVTIGNSAFAEAGILSINFPAGLKEIGENAFYGCFYLTNVNLPSSLNTIGTGAFSQSGLVGINLPANITVIEDSTFEGCNDLRYVNLSSGLTSLGSHAIASPSVSAISSPAQTPPATFDEPFAGINNYACSLSIPAFSFNEYISAEHWGAFVEVNDCIDITIDGNPDITYSDEEDYQSLLRSSIGFNAKGKMAKRAANVASVNPAYFAKLFNGAQMYVAEKAVTRYFFNGNISDYKVEYNGVDVTKEIDPVTKSWKSPEMNGAARLNIINANKIPGGDGVEGLSADMNSANNDVYNSTGLLLIKDATEQQIRNLTPGLYIIGGKKVMIKR